MNRRTTRSFVAGWVALSALVGACGKDDSLGDDNNDALSEKGSGGAVSSTGGAKSQTGGTQSKGGANGSGGGAGMAPQAGSGGTADCGMVQCLRAIECVESCGGPVQSSGCCPCPTGTFDQIQCSTGSGGEGGTSDSGEGGAATAGGSPPAAGGSAPTGGAPDGMAGSDGSDPGDPLNDPDATGSGECADRTLGEIIAEIHEANPDLASVTMLDDPNNPVIGGSQWIHAFRAGDGFRLVFVRGTGDCPAGCINREYWYFETNASCEPISAGHYSREYNGSDNCYRIIGEPLWDHPQPQPDGVCELSLEDLNTNCVSDTCPAGLTPDFFYGAAGTLGPLFCLCTIPCEDDPAICPDTTVCQYLADGPGDVCYRP